MGVREWMSADDDECRMPTTSASATHTTLWTVEVGKKHLQCEAGRARVPRGQLVRQFGSGQTDRERRKKQVGWKVFQTKQYKYRPCSKMASRRDWWSLHSLRERLGRRGPWLSSQDCLLL